MENRMNETDRERSKRIAGAAYLKYGLTVRDYLASQALMGLMLSPDGSIYRYAIEAAKEESAPWGGGGNDQKGVNAQQECGETQHKYQGRGWAGQVFQDAEVVVASGRIRRRRRIVADGGVPRRGKLAC